MGLRKTFQIGSKQHWHPANGPDLIHGARFEHAVAPARPVEGIVRDLDTGKPIAGAEVVVHQVVKNGPREYTRTDYDTATTDPEGKWSSSSVPAGFEGFSFQLTHPDYRPALYTISAITSCCNPWGMREAPRPVFPKLWNTKKSRPLYSSPTESAPARTDSSSRRTSS